MYLRRLKAAASPAVDEPGWPQEEGAALEDTVANEPKFREHRNLIKAGVDVFGELAPTHERMLRVGSASRHLLAGPSGCGVREATGC